jgi:hypothetical protein
MKMNYLFQTLLCLILAYIILIHITNIINYIMNYHKCIMKFSPKYSPGFLFSHSTEICVICFHVSVAIIKKLVINVKVFILYLYYKK